MKEQGGENRICWYRNEKNCRCKKDESCWRLTLENAKLVYCNDNQCMFNIDLPYKYFVDRGKNHKPFDDDAFTGVCGRKDVAVSPKVFTDEKTKHKVTYCKVRSDKKLSHPHFVPHDSVQTGIYPDPITEI